MRHFNNPNLKQMVQCNFKTVSLFLFSVLLALSVSATVFNVNTTNDTHAANLTTGDDGTGRVSFRSALEAANNLGGTHIINVPGATYNLTLGRIIMNDKAENITINGSGAATTIVRMTTALQGRILLIGTTGLQANMVTTINNMQFTGGYLTSDDYGGGAILAGGPSNSLTLNGCIFQNNTVPVNNGSGGAVRYNGGGTLTIDNCTFNSNTDAAADGGAVSYFLENLVSAGNGSVSITNSTFTNNTVTNTAVGGAGGGAVYISAQGRINPGVTFSVSILENTFTGNATNAPGGAGGAIKINNGFDVGNTAQVHYNRIVNNTSTIAPNGLVMVSAQGSVNANDNWWGCNTGPNVAGTCDRAAIGGSGGTGTLTTATWLQLQTTASPTTICNTSAGLGNTSNITTSFLKNSAGISVSLANLSAIIGRTVTWSSTLGSLSGQQGLIQANGQATALFTSNGTGGTATVNAVVDNLTATETSPSRASITVNTLPTVTNPTNTITCAGSTATFTSTITGTPAPTIHWRIGATELVNGLQASGSTVSGAGTATLTITNAQPGDAANYNVQASNHCGLAGSTDATLTVNIPSVAPTSISGTTIYCNPGSTTLTAVGGTLGTGANYQWGTGSVVGTSPLTGETASTLTVSPTSTTTYWVRIVNTAAPCTPNTSGVTQTVTVNQPSIAPTSISGTATVCNGSSTTLTAAGGTLGTGANYQWGTGSVVGTSPLTGETASTLTVSPSSATTYWVRIENTTAPCEANTGGVTQAVTVTQPSVAPTDITGTAIICNGGSTILTVVGGTLGTGANYQWGTGSVVGSSPLAGETASTLEVSPTSTTTYWVRMENTTAPCTPNTGGVTQVVTVNQPSVAPTDITGATTVCNGSSTTLTAAGGTLGTSANYQWGTGSVVGTSPLTGETASTLTVSPTSTTTYWVRIEHTTSPCTANTGGVTQLLTVNQPSVAPTSITGTTTVCNGGSTTLTAAGGTLGAGANYQWGTGNTVGTSPLTGETASTLTVSPTSTTTYWVRIENTDAPCSANTGGPTQVVTVNQPSIAPTGITGTTTVCNGGSTTLTVAGGSKGTGATTEWFTGSCDGTSAGMGNSITVSPTTTTTYFVRYNGTCNTTNCTTVTVSVASNNSINLTSAAGTDAQTTCINTPITNITYSTTGATGASFSGLPAGVTGSWLGDEVTISGTPSASGTFNYIVTLTGGCGSITANGFISVNPVPIVNAPSVTQPTCAVPTGTIVVDASASGTLEYRLNSGTWQTSNTFGGLAPGSYSISVRLQNNTTCVASYSSNPVVLNAATGCTVPPTFTLCPATKTVNTDAGVCSATLTLATLLSYVTATGTPAPTLTVKVGATTVTSSYAFPKGNTTVTVTASNGTLPNATCSFTVTVQDNQQPVIRMITNPIVLLWSPNHKYQTLNVAQFVSSVTDNCGSISVGNVVITKATSDEADNAPGNADGNTTQDIKIAANCKSIDLRSERMDGGNGRVYTIYFRVTDSKGNLATATAKAIAAPNQSGTTAVDNGPVYTVNSSCNNINTITQTKSVESSSATATKPGGSIIVQNYPNPFSSFTTIRYQLPADAQVSLAVYNALGQKVAHLVNGQISAGKHAVRFDATDRVGGIYLYRLQTTDAKGKPVELSGKMIIMK